MGRSRIEPEDFKKVNRNVSIPIYVDTFFREHRNFNLSEIVSNYLMKFVDNYDNDNKE